MPQLRFDQVIKFPNDYELPWEETNPLISFSLVERRIGDPVDIFSRYDITRTVEGNPNYSRIATSYAKDSSLALEVTGNTAYHWNFKDEYAKKGSFMIGPFGPFPDMQFISTLSPWTWDTIGSYPEATDGILDVISLSDTVGAEFRTASEVEDKWYTGEDVLTFYANTDVGDNVNTKPFRFYHDNEKFETQTIVRFRNIAFTSSSADIGGVIIGFGNKDNFAAPDGVLLSSGFPALVLVRNNKQKRLPLTLQLHKKYKITTTHEQDKICVKIEDDSEILLEDCLEEQKYRGGYLTQDTDVTFIGPTLADCEEILINAL